MEAQIRIHFQCGKAMRKFFYILFLMMAAHTVWGQSEAASFGWFAVAPAVSGDAFPDTVLVLQDFALELATNGWYTPDQSPVGVNTGYQGTAASIMGVLATNGVNVLVADGIDDFFGIADHSSLDFTGFTPFTIEVWINRANTDASEGIILKVNTALSSRQYLAYFDSGSSGLLYWQVCSGSSANMMGRSANTFDITPNEWHHYVFINAGTTNAVDNKIYVDAVQKDNTTASAGNYTGIVNTANSIWVGAYSDGGGGALEAKFGPIKFHNKILSPAEITNSYNVGTNIYFP